MILSLKVVCLVFVVEARLPQSDDQDNSAHGFEDLFDRSSYVKLFLYLKPRLQTNWVKKKKKKSQHILIKANQITFKHWWRKITSPTSSTPRLSSINLCPHFSLPVLLSSSLSMLCFFLTSPSLLLLLLFLHSNRDDVKYRRNNASYPTAGKLSNNSNINLTNSIQLPGPAWY